MTFRRKTFNSLQRLNEVSVGIKKNIVKLRDELLIKSGLAVDCSGKIIFDCRKLDILFHYQIIHFEIYGY